MTESTKMLKRYPLVTR